MIRIKASSIHFFLLIVVVLILIWSLIKPEEGYKVWLMEVSPSLLVLIILISRYNHFRLTTISYCLGYDIFMAGSILSLFFTKILHNGLEKPR